MIFMDQEHGSGTADLETQPTIFRITFPTTALESESASPRKYIITSSTEPSADQSLRTRRSFSVTTKGSATNRLQSAAASELLLAPSRAPLPISPHKGSTWIR